MKPSYCLQEGACTGNGEGTAQMPEKCQMPAGSVQFISPSEMFTPGKRVPARLECAGPRPHLLAAFNKPGAKVVWKGGEIKERLNGAAKHRLPDARMA